jgi:hypothetical protein
MMKIVLIIIRIMTIKIITGRVMIKTNNNMIWSPLLSSVPTHTDELSDGVEGVGLLPLSDVS